MSRAISKTIWQKMFSYIAAGLGLVIGLAWNEAITSVINYFFPNKGGGTIAKIIYAILITLVIGVILFYIERSLNSQEKE